MLALVVYESSFGDYVCHRRTAVLHRDWLLLKEPNRTDSERFLQRLKLMTSTIDRRRRRWTPSAGESRCFSWFQRSSNNFRFAFFCFERSKPLPKSFRSTWQKKITFFAARFMESSLRESLVDDDWSRYCIAAADDWTERAEHCPAQASCAGLKVGDVKFPWAGHPTWFVLKDLKKAESGLLFC